MSGMERSLRNFKENPCKKLNLDIKDPKCTRNIRTPEFTVA